MNVDYAGSVLLPAAPGWNAAKLFHPFKVRKIKNAIRNAGREFAVTGHIQDETTKFISQPLFTTEQYVDGANKEFKKKLDKLG